MRRANARAQSLAATPEDEEFAAVIAEHFDASYYAEAYGDVAESGLDPLDHWLDCGIEHERQMSRTAVLRYGKIARRSSSRIWRHYRWRGQDIAVRLVKPIPPHVVAQIINQARHDPAVLAAGGDIIPKLQQQDRENAHVDIAGLQRAAARNVELLVLAPGSAIGDSRELVTDLVVALRAAGFRSIQTIVTDQESCDAPVPPGSELYWHDFWLQGPEHIKLAQLAQLIRLVNPRAMIVTDSSLGYEIVARFGRALSAQMKIYCMYAATAESRAFAARFARLTLPFATLLTDDAALAAAMRERRNDFSGSDVALLPHHSQGGFRAAVAALFQKQ